MHLEAKGDVSKRFTAYTRAQNQSLLDKTLQSIAPHLPPGVPALLARYPEQQSCQAPK